MTGRELARAAGISQGHLSRTERSETMPSFLVASRIAEVLGIRTSDPVTLQRRQVTTDADLISALTSRGLDPLFAAEIRNKISTQVRQALLEALSD